MSQCATNVNLVQHRDLATHYTVFKIQLKYNGMELYRNIFKENRILKLVLEKNKMLQKDLKEVGLYSCLGETQKYLHWSAVILYFALNKLRKALMSKFIPEISYPNYSS